MRKGNVIGIGVLAATVLLGRAPTAAWAADVQADLHRAYYLQHKEKKYEAAAALYARLAEGSDTPAAVRDTARRELDRCRAALLTADPARLMPAETLAYVEVRNTGGQIERLVEMLGLLGSPTASGQQPADDAIVPMGRPELAIPRLKISPALLREIKKIGGIAVGLTGFQPGGEPEGVAVIDPGTCDLLRGALEMGIPALTPIGEIEGWPAFGIERAGVVVTERLILVGYPRSNVEALAKALRSGQTANTLAADAGFADAAKWRDDSTVFGYVNAKMLIPAALEIARARGAPANELGIARAMLDLDHVRSMAFRAGVTETGVSADASVRFEEGHQSLVLNFSRTPPLSRNSLKCVPSGAVAVVAVALSPADAEYSAGKTASAGVRKITGLDFGREIFANIEEIAAFVMPPGTAGPGERAPRIDGEYVPDGGIVITVKDPAQSHALWSQILAIPTLILGPSEASAETRTVGGVDLTVHRFPRENIQFVYANVDNHIFLGTSERAVSLMARTARDGKSVLDDKAFATVTKRLDADASKLVMLHAGRASKLAASYAPQEAAIPLRLIIPQVAKDLVVCVVSTEGPNELAYHAAIDNLPDLRPVLKQLELFAGMVSRGQADARHRTRVARRAPADAAPQAE